MILIKTFLQYLFNMLHFIMLFMLWASEVKGDEIEEIVVTAPNKKRWLKQTLTISSSLMSAIMPTYLECRWLWRLCRLQ